MKRYLTLLVIAVMGLELGSSQTKIALQNAGASIGDTVKICDKITATNFLQHEPGRPTYLTLASDNTEQQLTIVIKGESRRRFDYKPEKDLLNRSVCVTGKLESVDGKLQIVINKQDDINIVDDVK